MKVLYAMLHTSYFCIAEQRIEFEIGNTGVVFTVEWLKFRRNMEWEEKYVAKLATTLCIQKIQSLAKIKFLIWHKCEMDAKIGAKTWPLAVNWKLLLICSLPCRTWYLLWGWVAKTSAAKTSIFIIHSHWMEGSFGQSF